MKTKNYSFKRFIQIFIIWNILIRKKSCEHIMFDMKLSAKDLKLKKKRF
jgi:hypothetical protein